MKLRIARLICRLRGHDERCSLTIFIDANAHAEHTHDCRRCLDVKYTETITPPIGPDMGLSIPDQRALLN